MNASFIPVILIFEINAGTKSITISIFQVIKEAFRK